MEEDGIGDTRIEVTAGGRGAEGVVETRPHALILPGGAANEAMHAGFYIQRQRMVPQVKGGAMTGVVAVAEDGQVDKTIVWRAMMAVVAAMVVVVVAVVDPAGVKERLVNAVDGGSLEMRKRKTTTKSHPSPSSN